MDLTVQALDEPEALAGHGNDRLYGRCRAPSDNKPRARPRRTLPAPPGWPRWSRRSEQPVRSCGLTREEMQTSQEELKSTNEELQSTNEELQSTNEELTTSKEEMQSMNEEMQTVNHELQGQGGRSFRTSNDTEEPPRQHGHRHLVSRQASSGCAVSPARRRRSSS